MQVSMINIFGLTHMSSFFYLKHWTDLESYEPCVCVREKLFLYCSVCTARLSTKFDQFDY